MGKADDIPQDVFEAAFSVVSEIQMQDAGSVESWDARASVARVARSILAERERCAMVAENSNEWPQEGAHIAAAIRKGSD